MVRTNRLIVPILSTAIGLPVCSLSKATSQTGTYDDPEGNSLLSTLPNRVEGKGTQFRFSFLTCANTDLHWINFDRCGTIPDDFKSVAADIRQNCQVWQRSIMKFSSVAKYGLTGKYDGPTETLFPPRTLGEQGMHIPIRFGLYSVSASGFDKTRTYTIAYIQLICGAECAGGELHLLTRTNEGWKEIKSRQLVSGCHDPINDGVLSNT